MLSAAVWKILQKQARLEGSTTYMSASVGANRTCGKSNRRLLSLVSETRGWKCRCPPLSKSRGKVCNGGTVGGWPGGVWDGLSEMLMLYTLSSATRDPPCFLFETAWYARVYQISRPYTCGGSFFTPDLCNCWGPGLMGYPRKPVGM